MDQVNASHERTEPLVLILTELPTTQAAGPPMRLYRLGLGDLDLVRDGSVEDPPPVS